MRNSRRIKRMSRNRVKITKMNLTSLMDVFTILVFFLLVNSSEVQTLPNAKDLALPDSIAEERARETVVVMVTDQDLLVQGRVVARIADVVARNELIIPELKSALLSQTERRLRQDSDEEIEQREVTIMGDREIPYSLLKRVMATCSDADYGLVSLAVLQKTSELQLAAGV